MGNNVLGADATSPNRKILLMWLLRLAKYYLMILLLFAMEKSVFLMVYFAGVASCGWHEILSTFYHAFHLDSSTACYFCVLPYILLTLQLAFRGKWFQRVLDGYTLFVLLVIIISAFGNLFLYDEWGMKLNYRIWYYLQKPDEVLRTATWGQLLLGLVGGLVLVVAAFGGYLKWIAKPALHSLQRFYWQASLLLLVGLPLIFVGMRGRLTGVPITQSNAFFSNSAILNDAATNTQWNLMKSTIRFYKSNEANIFATMDDARAREVVAQLFSRQEDSCVLVLNQPAPNIVFIFLESWSADLVESLGGKAGIAPCFAELEKEGLLFTQVYAAGHRSQEGISAMLSGNPPIPLNVITDSFDKYRHLSSLPAVFNSHGYHTSFYFGGDLDYGNLKAYLMSMGVEKIVDEDDFPAFSPHGSLSIYDEVTLSRHLQDMRNESQPFFSVVFTASSHSPYDVPTPPEKLKWDMDEMPYVNSAHYTDYCLGKYFEQVRHESWYANTLFVLVADHSHPSYKGWNYYDAGYQHIPMLWMGGALKEEWRGKQICKLCSYVDLPRTILKQLGYEEHGFRWSRNILELSSIPQFAAYATNNGVGWITAEGSLAYDVTNGRIYRDSFESDSLREIVLERAKAYLQETYRDYLEK